MYFLSLQIKQLYPYHILYSLSKFGMPLVYQKLNNLSCMSSSKIEIIFLGMKWWKIVNFALFTILFNLNILHTKF